MSHNAAPRARPTRIPGSQSKSSGMRQYTIVFKESARRSDRGRQAFVTDCVNKTEADLETLKALIVREQLQAELGAFGEPTAFGMVGLLATPRLAERLERSGRVKAVIAD
ncbi:hypothetical protein [Methylobacterium sp.]|uniref:hypothetical protein n=1 Tax=Methylobacterium sp. TaxID=409 RepID=UPI003B006B9A